MNDAFNENQAETCQSRGDRRVPHVARLLRNSVVACVLACTAAGAIAAGQDRSTRREDQQQQSMRDRYDNRAQDPRFDQRAYDEARRQQEQALREQAMREQAMQERRSGRMTADERRELKRQINEANVELYPNARRR